MSDTVEVKYIGADTEGVTLQPVIGAHAGQSFVCPHGEWVALPTDLAKGTDHTYDLDYAVPENPAEIDSDHIVEHGVAALPLSDWEIRAPKSNKPEPVAAPATEED